MTILPRIRIRYRRWLAQGLLLRQKSLGDFVLILCLATMTLVDTLNGPLLENGLPSFSQPYKQLFQILVFIRLLYLSPQFAFLSLGFGIPFFASDLYAAITDGAGTYLGKDMGASFKQLIFVFVLFYLLALAKKFGSEIIQWVFWTCAFVSFGVVAINLILGSFGLGYAQYTVYVGAKLTKIGTRGLMFDGNSVAAYLIFFSICLSWWFWQNQRKLFLPFLVLVQFLAVAKATKVALLSALVCGLGIPIFYERMRIFKSKSFMTFITVALVVSVAVAPLLWQLFSDSSMGHRLIGMYNSVSFISFVLSDRNVFLENSLDEFSNHYSFGDLILGRGYRATLFSGFGYDKTIELDFFDILMQKGLLGVFFSYGLWISLLTLTLLRSFNAQRYPMAPLALFIGLISIALSFLSGHIIGSGVLGPFNALFFALAWVESVHNENKV